MDKEISDLIIQLTEAVAEKFKLEPQEALAVTSSTKIANDLAMHGNTDGLSFEALKDAIFVEIAHAQ